MWVWGRLILAFAAAATTAGCFQPLYSQQSVPGTPPVAAALEGVDILQIPAASGTEDARIAVQLRNDLLFAFQGGGGGGSPTHALKIRVTPSRSTTSVDLQTGRSDTDIYSITATYDLTDLRTGKVVLRDKAFAPVSYDTPGEQQRFARARALRDAEDRAAQLVADTIKGRLSSFFVAGS
ncbi:MAG: LPS assembly lipoprotein LptE [Xanthobacteraceae bacterium]|jgi:LPS-assembly lipoprotein